MKTTRALALLALVLLLAGCWSDPVRPSNAPSSSPATGVASPDALASASPAASGAPASPDPVPLLSIETVGGECPSGACDRLVNLDGDGRLHEVIPKDRTVGTVPKELVEAIEIEMAQANYARLQSVPFKGECPTAVDGQKVIYTFHVPTGDETFDSCKVAIDQQHPLFRAVAAALAFETP